MAPTPERAPRLVLLIALSLVVAGAGSAVFALLDQSESSPPSSRELTSVLDAARPAGGDFPGLTEAQLAVGEDCLSLVVADTVEERSQGLRARETLGVYDGMLFVNEADTTAAYTMAGVPVPLDIGWYAADGEPVDRTEMQPCPEGGPGCPRYSADGRYRFAVETLGGGLPGGALGACPS
jgi:uncharacterized membrane protein (UPF0127 family)